MKKYFIIAASALVAMCACTKNEVAEAPQQEINFAVANYAGQTKADPTVYPTTVPFGTYAYFCGEGADQKSASQAFMVDETVSYGSNWSASKTYYWPKSGTIDFISYSPKTLIGATTDKQFVTIAESSIKFGTPTNYTVAHYSTDDVMYADKAIDCSKTLNSTSGVPTVFRHALSKININIKTQFDEKGTTGNVTKWAVTITKLSVKNYYNTGSQELTLNTDKKSWVLPTDNVWGNNGTAVTEQEFTLPTDKDINSTAAKDFVTNYFMLPQILTDGATGAQTLYIEATIVTTLPSGATITEKNVPMSTKFYTTAVDRWGINKNITYNVEINPAGDEGPKAIFFTPSVVDWDSPAAQELKPTDE